VMDQESEYLAALQQATRFEVHGDQMDLYFEDGARAATFIMAKPFELAGTSWTVNSYNNGRGGVTTLIIDTEIPVMFDVDTVSGNAGCNDFSGGYEVNGENIAVGPLASTQKWCDQPEGIMDQEAEFLAALEGAVRFEVQGNRMDMYFEDGARAVVMDLVQ
ncbi:MAG: META domain-containing protein, partial [Candidatus Promineifilaceae bacterium]